MKTLEDITRQQRVENSINELPSRELFSVFGCIASRRFADIYLWSILKKIFDGLHNVALYPRTEIRDEKQSEQLEKVLRFVMENAETIIYELWSRGYIAIGYDRKPYLYESRVLRTDAEGRVVVKKGGKTFYPPCVYYSQPYRFSRRSDFDIIKNNIGAIDKYASADEYLTETLGAFGILCGKNMPISEQDKDNFMQRLMRKVGIGRDRMQIVPFNSEVEFKQVTLPIAELNLSDKLKNQMQLLAGYFGVPYDVLPIAGASTYANQRQAIINFYSSCVSPLAEILLSITRMLVRVSGILVPESYITFRIDNVPELQSLTLIDVDYKQKLVTLYGEMKEKGLPTEEIEKEINTYNR